MIWPHLTPAVSPPASKQSMLSPVLQGGRSGQCFSALESPRAGGKVLLHPSLKWSQRNGKQNGGEGPRSSPAGAWFKPWKPTPLLGIQGIVQSPERSWPGHQVLLPHLRGGSVYSLLAWAGLQGGYWWT